MNRTTVKTFEAKKFEELEDDINSYTKLHGVKTRQVSYAHTDNSTKPERAIVVFEHDYN